MAARGRRDWRREATWVWLSCDRSGSGSARLVQGLRGARAGGLVANDMRDLELDERRPMSLRPFADAPRALRDAEITARDAVELLTALDDRRCVREVRSLRAILAVEVRGKHVTLIVQQEDDADSRELGERLIVLPRIAHMCTREEEAFVPMDVAEEEPHGWSLAPIVGRTTTRPPPDDAVEGGGTRMAAGPAVRFIASVGGAFPRCDRAHPSCAHRGR